MLIGTIQNVTPPDHQDQYGNHYQNITIIDGAGMPHQGRIASKTPYTQQDVGKQGQWDVEQKQSSQGPYQKFKRHYDKPYGVQQGSYQGPQGPQHAAERPKGEDMVRIRSMADSYVKDMLIADKVQKVEYWSEVVNHVAFITTGTLPPLMVPSTKSKESEWPEPSGVDGPQDIDPPLPPDDDVPY